MSNIDPIDKAEANIIKRNPVLTRQAAFAIVAAVLAFLVTHGVITHVQADALTQTLVTIILPVLAIGTGWLQRAVVVPGFNVAKRIEAEVEKRLNAAPKLTEPAAIDPGAVDTR